ncbi:hypothetical protein E2C01_096139 [Portunus trituberculatus]|uniref:Uncharacterized protein n=1 Tax=Portunus trituberculatus TaxID=210409 RepID=A0A5B7JUV1_PORTR|nr:hypothetical protein [Portunus trituberculatus]
MARDEGKGEGRGELEGKGEEGGRETTKDPESLVCAGPQCCTDGVRVFVCVREFMYVKREVSVCAFVFPSVRCCKALSVCQLCRQTLTWLDFAIWTVPGGVSK